MNAVVPFSTTVGRLVAAMEPRPAARAELALAHVGAMQVWILNLRHQHRELHRHPLAG